MDMADRRWHQPLHRSIQGRPMTLKEFLLRTFTWWNGTTFGTMLWTARFGELVGTDEYGNRYLARLDAPHRRHTPDRGEGDAAAVVEAAPPESHRHSGGLPPDRLDARPEPPAEGDGRLQALGPRPLKAQALADGCARTAPLPYSALAVLRPFGAAITVLTGGMGGAGFLAPVL
jgi:hypothetical protein